MNKQIKPLPNINISKVNLTNKQEKINDIVKKTKCLILSSKHYKDYTQQYLTNIHINTFKQPEIDTYPLLKNNELVSLTTKTFLITSRSLQTCTSFSPPNKHIDTLLTTPVLMTEPYKPIKRHRIIKSEPDFNFKFKKTKHRLLDILFNEPYYLTMSYDESMIFHKEAIYISYLKKKTEEFKYIKCSNLTTEVFRSFNNNTVLLKCQSMTLEFINLTNKTKKPIRFNLPFSYLPLFYLKDYDNIKYILLSVIKFNETFDKIFFDDEAIYNFMKNSSPENTNPLSKIAHAENNDWNWTRFQSNREVSSEYSLLKKQSVYISPRKVIKANDKTDKQFNILSPYYNTIQKDWITPKYKYHMNIKMPTVTMILPKKEKEIKKTLDPEIVIFLLMNNFSKWDFYLANYLVSIKSFRWIIKQTLSKSRLLHFKDNDYYKQKANEEMMKQITTRTLQGFEYFNLTKRQISTPKEQDTTYHFYQTDSKGINNYLILHNYTVTIFSKLIKANKEFKFSFDLNQMKKLHGVSYYQNLDIFINKITVYNANTETLSLRYEIFKDLDIESIIKDKSSNKKVINVDQVKDLKISIVYPHLEKIEYVSNATAQSTSIISDTSESVHQVIIPEVLDGLCRNDISQWAEILCNVKNDNCEKTVSFNLNKDNQRDKSFGVLHKKSSNKLLYKKNSIL